MGGLGLCDRLSLNDAAEAVSALGYELLIAEELDDDTEDKELSEDVGEIVAG